MVLHPAVTIAALRGLSTKEPGNVMTSSCRPGNAERCTFSQRHYNGLRDKRYSLTGRTSVFCVVNHARRYMFSVPTFHQSVNLPQLGRSLTLDGIAEGLEELYTLQVQQPDIAQRMSDVALD